MGKRSGLHTRFAIIVTLLTLGAFFVIATDTVATAQDDDYAYTVSGGVATITGYNGAGGMITIPSTLGGFAVVAIEDFAFESKTSLISITIPDSVTSIGNFTFEFCTSMTSVTIGSGVASIGGFAFESCTSLTVVTIPEGVTSIGIALFSDCTSLTAIDTNVGNPNYTSVDGVLYDKALTALIQCPCGKVGTLTIPSSVVSIGGYAFDHCTSLTSVTMGSNVTSIGNFAFESCTSLTAIDVSAGNLDFASIDGVLYDNAFTKLIKYPGGKAGAFIIPETITSISSWAFAECVSLTSVTIPNNVTEITYNAFQSCTSLTSISIPNNVTIIGRKAFFNCTALTSVTLGSGVGYISSFAFGSCTSLTSITFLGLVSPTAISEGWIQDANTGVRGHAFAASDFPVPGSDFHGLTMGAVIGDSTTDNTMLILAAAVIIALVLVAALFTLSKRKKKSR